MAQDPLEIVFAAIEAQRSRNPRALASAESLFCRAATAATATLDSQSAKSSALPSSNVFRSRSKMPAASGEKLSGQLPHSPLEGSATASLPGSKAERLEAMRASTLACMKCPKLAASRTQVVFGIGNADAELMLIGEAPGADEDLAGEPFVGKAGQLLTKIIETMGFYRRDVYIANVLKCRPDTPHGDSGNRKPTAPEMETCRPYLLEQIQIIQPRIIVALGSTALEGLLGEQKIGISKLRGHWQDFQGIPLMPTFHPAYLLRNQSLAEKRKVWEDMLAVLAKLGRPISEKQRGYFLPK